MGVLGVVMDGVARRLELLGPLHYGFGVGVGAEEWREELLRALGPEFVVQVVGMHHVDEEVAANGQGSAEEREVAQDLDVIGYVLADDGVEVGQPVTEHGPMAGPMHLEHHRLARLQLREQIALPWRSHGRR